MRRSEEEEDEMRVIFKCFVHVGQLKVIKKIFNTEKKILTLLTLIKKWDETTKFADNKTSSTHFPLEGKLFFFKKFQLKKNNKRRTVKKLKLWCNLERVTLNYWINDNFSLHFWILVIRFSSTRLHVAASEEDVNRKELKYDNSRIHLTIIILCSLHSLLKGLNGRRRT